MVCQNSGKHVTINRPINTKKELANIAGNYGNGNFGLMKPEKIHLLIQLSMKLQKELPAKCRVSFLISLMFDFPRLCTLRFLLNLI
jgi:hypothetical protein